VLDCLTGLKREAKKGFKMILKCGWFYVDGGVGGLEAILCDVLWLVRGCGECGGYSTQTLLYLRWGRYFSYKYDYLSIFACHIY